SAARTQRSSLPISTPVTRIALGPWVSSFHFAEEGLEDLAEAFRLLDRGHVRAVLEDDPLGAADAVGDRADHRGGREIVATRGEEYGRVHVAHRGDALA